MQGLDLVIDVGNTRMKAALYAKGRLLRWTAWPHGTPGSWESLLNGEVPARAAMVQVADPPADVLAGLEELIAVRRIHGSDPSPLRMGYDNPHTLGADRLANAVGAWSLFPGRSCLAIDMGTCITYDLVDATGAYGGGAISPGARMRARAMHAFSARLPEVDLEGPSDLPALSTADALRAGIHHGIRGELAAMVHSFTKAHPGLAVVLTGGDSLRYLPALESGIFADPLLTLRGTLALLDHSTSAAGAGGAV